MLIVRSGKTTRRAVFWMLILCAVILASHAQATEIIQFQDGVLIWSNAYTQGVYTIQWASSLTGTWYDTWGFYNHQPILGTNMWAQVPMYYRVLNDSLQMSWVTVSNSHNEADVATGFGAVNYTFKIGKYEVSNGEYVEFLNSVDRGGSNTYALYSAMMGSTPRGGITNVSGASDGFHYACKANMATKPVNYVSFWDAARFVNWLNNGQGNASTESGVYELTTKNPPNTSVSRIPGARYFIPSEDEWYKAAYSYVSTFGLEYRLYPVQNDSPPTIARCDSTGNITNDSSTIANYALGAAWGGVTGTVTDVGSGGAGSQTYYGAADMAGNVDEWNEGIVATNLRCIRGGAWYSPDVFLQSTVRDGYSPSNEFDSVGFRIATR